MQNTVINCQKNTSLSQKSCHHMHVTYKQYVWFQFCLCYLCCVVFLVVVVGIAMAHCLIFVLLYLSSWLSLSFSMIKEHSADITQIREKINTWNCYLLCFWKSTMKSESLKILSFCFSKSLSQKSIFENNEAQQPCTSLRN